MTNILVMDLIRIINLSTKVGAHDPAQRCPHLKIVLYQKLRLVSDRTTK